MKLNIKIWDYRVKAEIKISPTPQFYMNIELPPMEMLWGMILIYKGDGDKKNGPKFMVDIRQGMVNADIQGNQFVTLCMAKRPPIGVYASRIPRENQVISRIPHLFFGPIPHPEWRLYNLNPVSREIS